MFVHIHRAVLCPSTRGDPTLQKQLQDGRKEGWRAGEEVRGGRMTEVVSLFAAELPFAPQAAVASHPFLISFRCDPPRPE